MTAKLKPKTAPKVHGSKIPRVDGKPGRPTDIGWHQTFLESMRTLPNVTASAKAAGVHFTTVYEHRERFPEFEAAWEASEKMGVQNVRGMAFRLATVGAARKKFLKDGSPIIDPATGEQYVEYEISESMISLILKNHLPEVYGDKSKLEVEGKLGILSDGEVKENSQAAKKALLATIMASLKGKRS